MPRPTPRSGCRIDDGDHWQSLRLDMPAISVRDIEVKDDSTCLCSDLVAGTHGRGFWILDDMTPLRQMAQARAARTAGNAYLFKPEVAVRKHFATNDPTPWPPELPAGQDAAPGALIDYYLPADARLVKLEILDSAGRVVRSYASDVDTLRNPDPGRDPAAYNKVCQRTTNAPDCSVPLYWPAPSAALFATAGVHRYNWDMHYNPIPGVAGGRGGGMDPVPHTSYSAASAPWASPGRYTVRLIVDGKSYTQPLVLKMDPRVQTPRATLMAVASEVNEMYFGALRAHAAYDQARALSEKFGQQGKTALKARVDSLAPEAPAGGRGFGRGGFGGRGGGAAAGPPTLDGVAGQLMSAASAMQTADVAPTASQAAAAAKARADLAVVMQRWAALKAAAGQ